MFFRTRSSVQFLTLALTLLTHALARGISPVAAQTAASGNRNCMQAAVQKRAESFAAATDLYNAKMTRLYAMMSEEEFAAWEITDPWLRKQALNRAAWKFYKDSSASQHELYLDKITIRHDYELASRQCQSKKQQSSLSSSRSSSSSFDFFPVIAPSRASVSSAVGVSAPRRIGAASCSCPASYVPVCSADGRLYYNACFASCMGVRFAQKGFCRL